MNRRSPIRHKVKKHTRSGYTITSYERGSGSHPTRVKKHVVVGQSSVKVPDWLIKETGKALKGVDPKDITLLRIVDGTHIFTGVAPPYTSDIHRKLDYICNRVVDESFTPGELGTLGCIGIFCIPELGFLGTPYEGFFHSSLPDGIMIAVNVNNMIPGTIIHELIHGLRGIRGTGPRDFDVEEKQTELEEVARIKNIYSDANWNIGSGYYQFVDSVADAWGDSDEVTTEVLDAIMRAVEHDRLLLTGSLDKNLVGEAAITRTAQKYPESVISTAWFSPAERVDRYFVVQRPGMREADVHLRFDDPPDESKVMSGLTKLYGSDAEIWEWKDGMKVRIQ